MLTPEQQNNDAVQMEREDFEATCAKIGDQLAELSSVDVPAPGYRARTEQFSPEDVDFASNTWLLRILDVQGWLNPSSEVSKATAEGEPANCARELFVAIGASNPQECYQLVGDVAAITSIGAELLGARLDIARQLQLSYLEHLETHSRKEAKEQWAEAWDEESDTEVPAPEPIRAKSDTWRISDFWGRASHNQLNLTPSYQRGDVWPTRDAQKLIESILRGIPLPSIILLKPKSDGRVASRWEVVDGKQRLTSILRFMGEHPKAVERVSQADREHPGKNLKELFKTDYRKFKRQWKLVLGEALTERKEAEYYYPFRLPQSSPALQGVLAPLAGRYYKEIQEYLIEVGDGRETVKDVFEMASVYKVAIIEYSDATPRQIHEVFHLYNRQGKHLNAEEIRNALFHEVDLVRLVLVASGDNPDVATLAAYVSSGNRELLVEISRHLDEYRFGAARYRRTKLLSWLYALLLQPSESNGALVVRSTAKQIDSLFSAISEDRQGIGTSHRLAEYAVLNGLVSDTAKCFESHSSADCWDPAFKDDDKGQKWQELQLVASLLGVFLLGEVSEDTLDVLDQHRDGLLAFTKAHRRPVKTQNATQWSFIGEVALGILATTKVDLDNLNTVLLRKYGISCLPTLKAAQARYTLDRP